jgi:hypothetical protein
MVTREIKGSNINFHSFKIIKIKRVNNYGFFSEVKEGEKMVSDMVP